MVSVSTPGTRLSLLQGRQLPLAKRAPTRMPSSDLATNLVHVVEWPHQGKRLNPLVWGCLGVWAGTSLWWHTLNFPHGQEPPSYPGAGNQAWCLPGAGWHTTQPSSLCTLPSCTEKPRPSQHVFNLQLYLPVGIGLGFFKWHHWEFVAQFQLCFRGFGK